jgi:hypothetical protein
MDNSEYLQKLIYTIEILICHGCCIHEKANVLTIAKYTLKLKKADTDYAIQRCEQFILKTTKAIYTKRNHTA